MSGEAHSLQTRAGVQPLRILAWVIGPAAIALTHWLTLDNHAIGRMCALVATTFLWMKLVVVTENYAAHKPLPSLRRLTAWTLLWPGMRPALVARTPSSVHSRAAGAYSSGETSSPRMDEGVHATNALELIADGLIQMVAGSAMVAFAYLLGGLTYSATFTWPYSLVTGVIVMVAFSLVVHYGLFSIATGLWRLAGFNVGTLFRNPFGARSLRDFWTRRWNLAYVEMCQETVMRATRSWAPATKRMAVFAFSGLLHEVAISLPVMRGFGLPTLYFVVNGMAIQLERKWFTEGSFAARTWAFAWVALPLPLLFHPWFLQGIVLPIVGIGT